MQKFDGMHMDCVPFQPVNIPDTLFIRKVGMDFISKHSERVDQ